MGGGGGGEVVLAPFVCDQAQKKNTHLHAAEKIDALCKITKQHKRVVIISVVTYLLILSVSLINNNKS